MYKEEILELKISDKKYSFIQISNIDEVFDHLIDSNTGNDDLDDFIPYWTELWPSAIGLSRFIIDHSSLITNKNVIEIGCGLGLPSIVAATYTSNIHATDLIKDALNFASKNAKVNNVSSRIKFSVLDWRSYDDAVHYDIVLASDVAYEQRFFDALPNALGAMMSDEGISILSEPGRKFTEPFLEALNQKFDVSKHTYLVEWRSVNHEIGIYVMKKK